MYDILHAIYKSKVIITNIGKGVLYSDIILDGPLITIKA